MASTATITKKNDLAHYVFQKLPPQAIDVEEGVLGALLTDGDAYNTIEYLLKKPEIFYTEAHQWIFHAIMVLRAEHQPIDLLTVKQKLLKIGKLDMCGNAVYLSDLTNRVGSAANIETWARIIVEKYLKRELIKLSTNNIKFAFDEGVDVWQLLNNADRDLMSLVGDIQFNDTEHISTIASAVLLDVEKAGGRGDGLLGISSGFTQLDMLTGGWQSNNLIIVAARPAMGKTSISLEFIRNAAIQFSEPVAFFSLEMSKKEVVGKIICAEANIPSNIFLRNKSCDAQKARASAFVERLDGIPIYINETPRLTITQFATTMRRLKRDKGVKMAVIDYLQIMLLDYYEQDDRVRIKEVSLRLKELAKELSMPIIALAQLSRDVEKRGGSKRPQLADIGESGGIERDADIVSFLYRPEYYNILEDEQGNSLKGVTEIIVAKNRNGATGTVKVRFDAPTSKFMDDTIDPSDDFLTNVPKPANERVTIKPSFESEDLPF